MRVIVAVIVCSFFVSCKIRTLDKDFARYVNPFIGNADNGHTFPGACAPFGMIQASPQSGNGSWRYCSGFNYEDEKIYGFGQTHLNGTGVPDLGDILLLPFSGRFDEATYPSRIDKTKQKALPGYYAVRLTDAAIDVEITATARTAFHRYTYQDTAQASLLLDLQSGLMPSEEGIRNRVIAAEAHMPDRFHIEGYSQVKGWVDRQFYYVIAFDKPYRLKEQLPPRPGEKAPRWILEFDVEKGESVQLKVALSTVSVDGAKNALRKENPSWDFEHIRQQTYAQWNDLLQKVEVTGTIEQKTNFYTSLYHMYIQPNNIADVDGQYRGADDRISSSPDGSYYSTLSLWDTYRAAHPLYTLLAPERVDGMVNSMLAHFDAHGHLPIWTLWGKENYCMIGNHAVPVIADAYLKGFRGFDSNKAYAAMRHSLTVSHPFSDWQIYDQYGYYPFDLIQAESVSKTLESAYDDYCVAQVARAMDKKEDEQFFTKRSLFYKNLFDDEQLLMRGKDSKGMWRTPFNPFKLSHTGEVGGDFTEGNAWQYTWHVQQDVEGLIELMGGKTKFAERLESLFLHQVDTAQTGHVHDVTGLIGQYAHGNEPSHHVTYLFNYVDRPSRTQELIREIFDKFYLPEPAGLCGNDDCGQMSAWYVFSAMGFYPVNPCGGEYIIGAPQMSEFKVRFPGDKELTIKAHNLSATHKYVRSVTWNGKPLKDFRIYHEDIIQGGLLAFEMTDRPQ